MVFGLRDVPGDGDCLFHALAFHDQEDGNALRIDLAHFMQDHALAQEGEEAPGIWLEEADALLEGVWGGDTAVTAYSLKRSVKIEIHIRQANDKVLVKDATHQQVPPDAETHRVFYNGRDHYSALVALQPGPQGWEPAWNQPPPVVYFKKVRVQDSFPPLDEAAALKTPKPKGFNKPRRTTGSKRFRKNGRKQEEAAQPMEVDEPMEVDGEGTGQEASQQPVKEDILAELGGIPVRDGCNHPHRKTEILIKAGEVKAFLFDNLSRK